MIRGIPQTKLALEKAQAQVNVAAPTATKAGAEAVAREATSRAPRRTGRMASSIRVTSTSSFGDGATSSAGTDVEYARFPEFGTVYIPGQHFMEQGADAAQGEIVASMAAIFKAAIT